MTSDVAVIGGGPAGLAAAIAAARQNLRVVVLESRQPPLDKACGEGLMPDALAILRELGVALPPGTGVGFRGIRFVSGELRAGGRFADTENDPGLGSGLGLRRTALHAALVAAAERSGVDLRFGVAAHGLAAGGVATGSGLLRSRFVVGADGLHSRVGAWAGLRRRAGRRARFGLRRHFARAPWTDHVEVHWGRGAEAYVTPVGAQEVGVALLWSGVRPSFEDLPARFPTLAQHLAGAPPTSRVRGAGPFDQRVPSVISRSVALLGDAAGYVDAITGEGIAIALHEAVALAPALAAGDLAAYARASRRLRRLPEAITRLLLAAERRPAVRERLIALLARDPRVFSRLLAVQTRRLRARRLGLVTLLRLAACWLPVSGDPTATVAL